MTKKTIVTYAEGAHEELLDVALPTYKAFADRHGYDLVVSKPVLTLVDWEWEYIPPAWVKIPLLIKALQEYEEVVWFDCDMVMVDPSDDFPELLGLHSMVRHFEECSDVPNSGVWRLKRHCVRDDGVLEGIDLLRGIARLEVFRNHGWWEQAALLTLMGYTVPPERTHFPNTKCQCVQQTKWYRACQFMRLCWNSHPNYRAEHPRIVHASYPDMPRRLEVMRALVRDPHYDYPRFEKPVENESTK